MSRKRQRTSYDKTMKKIKKKDIGNLLRQWQSDFAVFTPSRKSGTARMEEWDGQDTSFLEWYRNTVIPPKGNIFPNMEEMFSFHKDGEGYHLELPAQDEAKHLIFAIRPCDARALKIIDPVFQDAYEDNYYLTRRENTLLVGLGCTDPHESCFCTSLGISPGESGDVDLMLTDIGEEFSIEEVTEKGKELLARTEGLVEAAQPDELRTRESREAAAKKISRKLDTTNLKERLLSSFEDKEFWEKAAAKCISCGICTFLCPTCYCFDINDETSGGNGTRFRSWDSCSFSVYTKMPAENPREDKWQRVRQKVCHKYEFYPRLFDITACTGCGRCIRLCPVNWDITRVLESVPEETTAQKENRNAN